MAFNDYRHAWEVPGLTGPQRLVLLYLAECRNGETGLCNPGYTKISRMTGMAPSTVSEAVSDLKRLVPLRVESNGHRRSNRYYFPWNDNGVHMANSSPDEQPKVSDCSYSEQGVHIANTRVHIANSDAPDYSPNEQGVRLAVSNKEENQESALTKKAQKEHNNATQPPAAGAAVVASQPFPSDSRDELEVATNLDYAFWKSLEVPEPEPKEKNVREFRKLLRSHPDLPVLLKFALIPKSRIWSKLSEASHPLGYLKRLLDTDEPWGLRPAYEKYTERAHAKPPDDESDDAARATGISTLEDEEDFGDAPVVGKEAATIEDIEA